MAHNCPDCGCQCHCKGDIDDLNFDQEPAGGCIHYKSLDCDGNEDNDEDDWDDDVEYYD